MMLTTTRSYARFSWMHTADMEHTHLQLPGSPCWETGR